MSRRAARDLRENARRALSRLSAQYRRISYDIIRTESKCDCVYKGSRVLRSLACSPSDSLSAERARIRISYIETLSLLKYFLTMLPALSSFEKVLSLNKNFSTKTLERRAYCVFQRRGVSTEYKCTSHTKSVAVAAPPRALCILRRKIHCPDRNTVALRIDRERKNKKKKNVLTNHARVAKTYNKVMRARMKARSIIESIMRANEFLLCASTSLGRNHRANCFAVR